MQSKSSTLPSSNGATADSNSQAYVLSGIFSRVPGVVAIILIMLFLKWHYSLASAAELCWILAPTARLVAWLTSANPVLEPGVGYVDFSAGIIVAPACAGINFMIMAFGLAAFSGMIQIRRIAAQLVWITLALVGAYGLALVVNTVRIAISMILYQSDIYGDWLTVERVHRFAGVGFYVSALWLYFLCLRPIITCYCGRFDYHSSHGDIHPPVWLTVVVYLLGSVGVPLLNRGWRPDVIAFSEHCCTVAVVALALGTTFMVMGQLFHAPFQRISCRSAAWCGKGYR